MVKDLKTRIQAVETYLKEKSSLKETSIAFKIPYQTLRRWVKWYKEGGKENIEKRFLSYKKPWNKPSAELEKKIALLKESNPSITVRKAKALLTQERIKISLQGIWEIWKRYGYAGFKKENIAKDFLDYTPPTKETERKLEQAQKVFSTGKIKKAAYILNSVPFLPKNELLSKIPDRYLNRRRRVEKIVSLFGEIPLRSYLKTKLYNECKKQKLNYLAFRVGINEIVALAGSGKPEKALKRIEELKKIIYKTKNHCSYLLFKPKFALLVFEGVICASLLKIKKAEEIAKTCRELLQRQKHEYPYLMFSLATLYMHLEDYKKEEYCLSNILDKVDEETNKRLKGYLAHIFLIKGEYKKAIFISKQAKFIKWTHDSWRLLFNSILSLVQGLPQKAISLALNMLSLAKKEELNIYIFDAYCTIASAYASLGEKEKARKILLKLISFLQKHKLKREKNEIEALVDKEKFVGAQYAVPILPPIKLIYLIKSKNYFKALSYAKKKYILTYFYIYIYFFPESVVDLLEKGRKTELPKAILQLPVFNKDIPVYNIKFLGDLIAEKNGEYLRFKLKPKDKAFLIHLALSLETPKKEIPLENLYENFWRDKSNPRSDLSHLLLRIKRALKIPSHLLEISSGEGVLKNRGIYFTTDYLEYEQALANGKAFLKGGEWRFAEREFLTAINLMRGAPFEKMYDNWSDEKRLAILNQYENEIAKFAKECETRKKQGLAKKVLQKAEKITKDFMT